MARKNPTVGTHPDLFKGESPIFVPLEDLTEAQIKKLPRSAFSEDEWEEVDEDVQEHIYETDEESQQRIAHLTGIFIQEYKRRTDEEHISQYETEHLYDMFEQFLAENAGDLIKHYDNSDDLIQKYIDEGYAEEDVEEALNEVLSDNNMYRYEVEGESYYGHSGSMWFWQPIIVNLYIEIDQDHNDGPTPREALEALAPYPDELERAVKEINDETDDAWRYVDFEPDLSDRYHTFDVSHETGLAFVVYPNTDDIDTDLGDALSEIEKEGEGVPEEPATPPEERVVHRFDDGAYVLDLHSTELPEEGKKMRMCVGREDMGYISAVKRGRTKILSLRTQSGRPKFTIELGLDNSGEPSEIVQIKGKANRLPGWNLGNVGTGKVKADEVQKLITVVEKLGFDPDDVDDLAPGARALKGLKSNPAPEEDACCGFCCKAA